MLAELLDALVEGHVENGLLVEHIEQVVKLGRVCQHFLNSIIN